MALIKLKGYNEGTSLLVDPEKIKAVYTDSRQDENVYIIELDGYSDQYLTRSTPSEIIENASSGNQKSDLQLKKENEVLKQKIKDLQEQLEHEVKFANEVVKAKTQIPNDEMLILESIARHFEKFAELRPEFKSKIDELTTFINILKALK